MYEIYIYIQFTQNFLNYEQIPLSGRNPLFKEYLGIKPHLLVLNKVDLADLSNEKVNKKI